jgi:CubicO group peptidase (beta-lactamase class C family)
MSARPFPTARATVLSGLSTQVYPAAAVEIGTSRDVVWHESFGRLSFDADADLVDRTTLFDLASLTKVIATMTMVMRLMDQERLAIDHYVARWLRTWSQRDRDTVTIRDLLAHSAGLCAHAALYESCTGRVEFDQSIAELPLEYPPRTQAVYSDLGFMLLAFICEDAGRGMPLGRQFDPVASELGGEVMFAPDLDLKPQCAPTGVETWRGRLLQGEVHDANAWALSGVAGHAGLFGTASGVGTFARLVLRGLGGASTVLGKPETLRLFATPTTIPASSRALGWDTMRSTSSCGTRMSASSIGHTGFTGTSLWIDPERDLYFVYLTNRTLAPGGNDRMQALRRSFHDAAISDIENVRNAV